MLADRPDTCTALKNPGDAQDNVLLAYRGNCYFVDKVASAEDAGAIGVVVADYSHFDMPWTMGGDPGSSTIPAKPADQANHDCTCSPSNRPKSSTFRVTNTSWWTAAIAAIWPSAKAGVQPPATKRALSRACHRAAVPS